MCERRVRTTVTIQISINVIKNILKDAITVYRDLCASVGENKFKQIKTKNKLKMLLDIVQVL